MNLLLRSLFVGPQPTTTLSDPGSRSYDALLCTLGYETRSSAVVRALYSSCDVVAVAGFTSGHTQAYESNARYFAELGTDPLEIDDGRFATWVDRWLVEVADRVSHSPAKVAIDISSMTRPRIAAVVQTLLRRGSKLDIVVDLLYVPAQYEPSPDPVDATTALEPVTPDFAGWNGDPDVPTVVIFGIGYEPERAAGALDAIDPGRGIPFFPLGLDDRFEADVAKANEQVLALPKIGSPIHYRIEDPFRCFAELDALVTDLEREERPVLLPLGPKLFAAIAILVAALRDPVTPVWRVSPGPFDEPADRLPEDVLITLRVGTRPLRDQADLLVS